MQQSERGLIASANLIKLIEARLELAMLEARKANSVVSVAYLDIDGFGKIEQTHGYGSADQLLMRVAEALASYAERDPVAIEPSRYVRDSFLIILRGMRTEAAFIETEYLRGELSKAQWPINDQDERIRVSFSGGVATYPDHSDDRAELIGFAEEAARRIYSEGGGQSTGMPRPEKQVLKSNYYYPSQLERLKQVAQHQERTEAALLREALNDLLRKYDQRSTRRLLRRKE